MAARGDDGPVQHAAPAWLREPQTYSMLPLLPERAREFHVSVNGIWAGISGDHPILPPSNQMRALRDKYGDDAGAFVADSHNAGLLVASVVQGIEGMPPLRALYPNLEAMACRHADGRPATNGEWLLMCSNNPDWIAVEIQRGKLGIDLGADIVMLDTPMGSAFLSGGMLKAGFCDSCMSGFERFLAAKFEQEELASKLALEGFDRQAVIPRLRSRQEMKPGQSPFVQETPDDLLFREFVSFQEQASFKTRRQVLESIRRYAAERRRSVALATNAADLGTQNPFGHWVRGLMFADLVDLFVYEQAYLPNGFPGGEPVLLPRGKWAAYHKLAHAAVGRRSAAVIHADAMGKILISAFGGKPPMPRAWLGALAAEAYAANGAFITFQIEPNPLAASWGLDRVWKHTVTVNTFVEQHRDLYAGELRSGSPLAIVFLLNERGRTIPGVYPSYLGFAQALAEGTYPFDVVFDGDGRYVRDRLSDEALTAYSVVLLPSPIDPTESQKAVIRRFVEKGGTLVCQEPERLGLDLAFTQSDGACLAGRAPHGAGQVLLLSGEVSATQTTDEGSRFFQGYEPEIRDRITRLARAVGLHALLEGASPGSVGVYPIQQPQSNRLVVHLVNYDIDGRQDRVRPKSDLVLRIPGSLAPSGPVKMTWHTPEAQRPQELTVTPGDERLTVPLPTLEAFGTLVITR